MIFISYRRSDSRDITARIAEQLQKEFKHVFYDKDSIRGGTIFPDIIRKAIRQSHVVLVIIGAK